MENLDKAQSRNIAIVVILAVALLLVFPCVIAALIAFGVAGYWGLSVEPEAAPPAAVIEEPESPAPPESAP